MSPFSPVRACMCRVGLNYIYIYIYIYGVVYIRYFWQGNHHIHGHIRCMRCIRSWPTLCMSAPYARVSVCVCLVARFLFCTLLKVWAPV